MNDKIKKIKEAALKVIEKKDKQIKELEQKLGEEKRKTPVLFEMAGSTKIENFPDVQKVEMVGQYDHVQRVKLENPVKVQKVEIVGRDKAPDSIKIENPDEVASELGKVLAGKDLEAISASNKGFGMVMLTSVKTVGEMLIKLWSRGLHVKISPSERAVPLYVIPVDEDGRVLKPQAVPAGFPGMVFHNNSNVPPSQIKTLPAITVIPGTPIPLSATPQTIYKMTISAGPNNANPIFYGDANVKASNLSTARGTPLQPTFSADIFISDLSKVYIDGLTNTDIALVTYYIL